MSERKQCFSKKENLRDLRAKIRPGHFLKSNKVCMFSSAKYMDFD